MTEDYIGKIAICTQCKQRRVVKSQSHVKNKDGIPLISILLCEFCSDK